jgi:hypothetical protein
MVDTLRGIKKGDIVKTRDGRKGVLVEDAFQHTQDIVGVDFTGAGVIDMAETVRASDLTLECTKEYIDDLADILDPHPSTIMREWLDSLVQK